MEEIPGPQGWPFIGNLLDIDLENSVQSLLEHSEQWGPIYKLSLAGSTRIILSSQELVNEVFSRKEFQKHITGAVGALSKVIPHGLFTSETNSPSWGHARRTLNPAFTPAAIKDMFDEMYDITSQLVLKWARHDPEMLIDVSTDFLRLTLDTIALTAMGTRFNSFYHDELHPFVRHFGSIFSEIQRRSNRPAWLTWMQWTTNRQFNEHSVFLREFCANVLTRRRLLEKQTVQPRKREDVFTAMLHRRDPVTGRKLTDDMIIDNMITFLFAGHDTTSGLLSFLLYHIICNPQVYTKVQREIDNVLKGGPMSSNHLTQLPYVKACLLEALRLDPPSVAVALTPEFNDNKSIVLGNKYEILRGQTVVVLVPGLHRDPTIFGEDSMEFKPERMLETEFKKLPKNAFKPFGNSPRSCIGSEFAIQEAMIATAVLFQRFDFDLGDPEYKLQYQPSLNRKPKDLFIKARLRPHVEVLSLNRDLFCAV